MDLPEVFLPERKIIHIDMDAFFASVEQRDFPELRGKPVAVGGSKDRGVVAAASYEARKYGVYSAMSSIIAARKCPELIFVKPRFDDYKVASQQIRAIFQDYTDLIEPLSLDEAYLDVTTNKKEVKSATLIAKAIKSRILAETKLTASAGISYNKFLAKMASDLQKPDGLSVILPTEALVFLEQMHVKKFHGIGKVTAERLHKMGIFTGKDLKAMSMTRLTEVFGKSATYFYQLARGVDNRQVNPSQERKSIGAENTFSRDLIKTEDILVALQDIFEEVWRRVSKGQYKSRTLTVKIKYHDFRIMTKSKTSLDYLVGKENYQQQLISIIGEIDWEVAPIRLLGISVSNFAEEKTELKVGPQQLTIGF